MKKIIYITRKIDNTGIKFLRKYYKVIIPESYFSPSKQEILNNVENVDAIICTLSEIIDSDIMDRAGNNLKVISTYSTGYDHIDVSEATKRNIFVANTGNILSEATADLTLLLILSIGRRIIEGSDYIKLNKWRHGWLPNLLLGSNIYGMNLGILGLGDIGRAVARRANGFNMKIYYHNRKRLSEYMEKKLNVKYVEFDEILKISDFLSIHLSLNKESFHIIDRQQLQKMKPTSYIINTSRGQVINQKSLIMALKKKWISGAGLDVYEKEPLSKSNPLVKMNNVITLPHLGSATIQTRSKMSETVALNVHNVFMNKKPLFLVNEV
ncbi:MAG: 2-hydroxyacid dehydrogenase [Nitrososphaeraceae archaeon]